MILIPKLVKNTEDLTFTVMVIFLVDRDLFFAIIACSNRPLPDRRLTLTTLLDLEDIDPGQ